MEVYNVPDQGLADTYLIQGVESNPQSIAQFDQYGSMYNEGAPDYIVDQGLYYPTGNNYGYICAGYEPTTNWEDQSRWFGLNVSVNEVEALHELFKKLSSSIFDDGLIHKVISEMVCSSHSPCC